MKYLIPLIIVVVVIIGVVILFFSIPSGPMEKEYTIRMREFAFKLEGGEFPLRIKSGEPVKIKLINEGAVTHELMIVKDKDAVINMVHEIIEKLQAQGLKGDKLIEAYEDEHEKMHSEMKDMIISVDVSPGTEKTVTFTIDEPGTYWAVCLEIEGSAPKVHADLGMFAQIIVEG